MSQTLRTARLYCENLRRYRDAVATFADFNVQRRQPFCQAEQRAYLKLHQRLKDLGQQQHGMVDLTLVERDWQRLDVALTYCAIVSVNRAEQDTWLVARAWPYHHTVLRHTDAGKEKLKWPRPHRRTRRPTQRENDTT